MVSAMHTLARKHLQPVCLSLAALAIMWSWCPWPSSWCCSAWSHTCSPHEDSSCGGDPRCTSPKGTSACVRMRMHTNWSNQMFSIYLTFFFRYFSYFSYRICLIKPDCLYKMWDIVLGLNILYGTVQNSHATWLNRFGVLETPRLHVLLSQMLLNRLLRIACRIHHTTTWENDMTLYHRQLHQVYILLLTCCLPCINVC